MQLPSIKEITDKAQNAFRRFPVTLIWAILGSLYVIWLIGYHDSSLFDEKLNIILTLIIGVSWLIGTQFFLEQQEKPKKWIWGKGVVLVLLFLFYWHLPHTERPDRNPEYMLRFFLYLIGGHLFVLFAPFARKWNKAAYWNYLKSVGVAIGRSAIFSGVLYLGLVLALVAIDALFEVNIRGERYGQLFIFCLGIVNTWIYLSDFPENILQDKTIRFERPLEVFVKYILIPLLLLYMVILYAYGIKIIFEWKLPKGWVSYLVTALALLGFVVQVIIDPVQKSSKAWTIHRFYPWFYLLLLPLIVLLFAAIFRRVADYGITENRYFVLVLASWILGMTIYLLFGKYKSTRMLPLTLFMLTFASSFGFWGAFKTSQRSQIGRFKEVYGSVKSNSGEATAAQFEQLQSILNYLNDRKSLPELNAITGISMEKAFKDTISEKETVNYHWLDTRKILDTLGVTVNPEDWNRNYPDGTYYSYYTDYYKAHDYRIEGFSYFTALNFSGQGTDTIVIGSHNLHFDSEKVALSIISTNDSNDALGIPLKEKLIDLTKFGTELYEVSENELILESENDSILVRLIFRELGYSVKENTIEIDNANVFIFLKQK